MSTKGASTMPKTEYTIEPGEYSFAPDDEEL